jgi:uncharacterized protein (TIGR03083 family)
MTPPAIAALRASHDRLRTLAEPLDGTALRGRAYPSDWSVAQVLSHLGSGAEIGALVFDAGIAGVDPPGREVYQPIWDSWNAKAPEEQAADALDADRRLVERYEALTADEIATVQFSIWSGPIDAAGLTLARLSEHAVHTWDVAVALDPAATVAPDAVDLLIDSLGRVAAFSGKPTGQRADVHVRTTDPDREFALSIGDAVTLSPWDGSGGTAELTLPAEAFVRLVYGRLDEAHTPAVSAKGVDLSDLREVFRGF